VNIIDSMVIAYRVPLKLTKKSICFTIDERDWH